MTDEEYQGVDDELLEDFEAELNAEEQSGKKRKKLILFAIVMGIVAGFYFATAGQEEPRHPVDKAPPEGFVTEEPKTSNVESQIAQLQRENLIKEDFKAPGVLIGEKPPETQPATKDESEIPEPEQTNAPAVKSEAVALAEEMNAADEAARETTANEEQKTGPEGKPVKTTSGVVIPVKKSGSKSEPEKEKPAEPAAEPTPEAKPEPAPQEPAPSEMKKPAVVASAAPPASGESTRYSVQVSATTNSLAALDLRDRLLKRGFDSWISMGKVRQPLFRVEAGEFKSIRESSKLSAMMGQAGFVTRTTYIKQGSRVTLVAGSFADKAMAEKLNDRIESNGFPSRIVAVSGSTSLYHVRVGKYISKEQAQRTRGSLAKEGFKTRGIVR